MSVTPTKAMVLAAGLGLRMRPLTARMPKPLVPVAGRALLDHVLDKLGDAGVSDAIVNVHYLPDQIIDHVATRAKPHVTISDERDQVLGTGGGVVKALPLLGQAPFFHVNADTMWIDGVRPNLARMAEAAERSAFSDAPAKVLAEDGGRIDVAALPAGVAIYIFPPGSWKSRSVRLVPRDARQLAAEMRHRGGTARRPARP